MEHRDRQLDVPEMTGTLKVGQITCLAAGGSASGSHLLQIAAHMSFPLIGPSLGSYSPPLFGKFKLSSKIGLSTFWTEIDRTSSVVRKVKEREEISDERGLPMSMMG
jgi:hypothetical protein